ncbi:CLUMA_CG010736, isoform A [Clunio marinus]|uniref:CLUMA_CG010736, isoform A n=1 Tax=Clunio marinus TaxID=568069 RepID=A0A1J1IFW7_9DIPT|nr:CLUMA_CG010736, isoform A [Clunio marinus]
MPSVISYYYCSFIRARRSIKTIHYCLADDNKRNEFYFDKVTSRNVFQLVVYLEQKDHNARSITVKEIGRELVIVSDSFLDFNHILKLIIDINLRNLLTHFFNKRSQQKNVLHCRMKLKVLQLWSKEACRCFHSSCIHKKNLSERMKRSEREET